MKKEEGCEATSPRKVESYKKKRDAAIGLSLLSLMVLSALITNLHIPSTKAIRLEISGKMSGHITIADNSEKSKMDSVPSKSDSPLPASANTIQCKDLSLSENTNESAAAAELGKTHRGSNELLLRIIIGSTQWTSHCSISKHHPHLSIQTAALSISTFVFSVAGYSQMYIDEAHVNPFLFCGIMSAIVSGIAGNTDIETMALGMMPWTIIVSCLASTASGIRTEEKE
ncbi:hypothetical protein BS50DRAFT_584344 [Corynespora cassiicola Philippines]|uniref:Uncharacterized protein n=1 Tax=Corynespora cassiicola Philippines TaxID=1448308 RepID=A0A2T2NZC1_CORCC|nr:hypothetical protein BS50DRAFT_584344 [Corynespora cassiicola Philippines]